MRPLDHSALADALLPAVLAAGRATMRYFKTGVDVEQKPDSSPGDGGRPGGRGVFSSRVCGRLPVACRWWQRKALRSAFCRARALTFFLVDPLDGTRGIRQRAAPSLRSTSGSSATASPVRSHLCAGAQRAFPDARSRPRGPGACRSGRFGGLAQRLCTCWPLLASAPDPRGANRARKPLAPVACDRQILARLPHRVVEDCRLVAEILHGRARRRRSLRPHGADEGVGYGSRGRRSWRRPADRSRVSAARC